ncbi:hypothetical protein QA596_11585 [Balneolales bacterium ANBcel1]|nr:hypothetical protein [Balneolales bacterium ANBcel1]
MNPDSKDDISRNHFRVPLMIEILPPELGKEQEGLSRHKAYLDSIRQRVPVDVINLPEIQDETQKGDRGKRRSAFKRRVSPRDYARMLAEFMDTEYVINRVIVKQPPADQEQWLLDTRREYGIRKVVFVGGESPEIEYPGPSVTEGNRMAKQFLNRGRHRYLDGSLPSTDFSVGNICIPNRDVGGISEAQRVFQKCESGADFFTTQIITESETPVSMLDELSGLLTEKAARLPMIYWSFTPVSAQKDIDFLRWLGVFIPEKVEWQIMQSGDPAEASLDLMTEVWERIHSFNSALPVPVPMALNITAMGLRNFPHARELATRLIKI